MGKMDNFDQIMSKLYRARTDKDWDMALTYCDQVESEAPNAFRKPNAWLSAIDRIRAKIKIEKEKDGS